MSRVRDNTGIMEEQEESVDDYIGEVSDSSGSAKETEQDRKRKRMSSGAIVDKPGNAKYAAIIRTRMGNKEHQKVMLSRKNPFILQKEITNKTGTAVVQMKALARGDLLVYCQFGQQLKDMLKIKTLCGESVNVKKPVSEETSEGVIYGVSVEIDRESLLASLKDQGVKTLYRLKSRKYDSVDGSTTVKLVFDTKEAPEVVYISYLRYRVKPYVPPVIRCYKCQRFGHYASACKGKERCSKCGDEHKAEACTVETKKCVNCKGDHSASWAKCPVRATNVEINKVQAVEKVSKTEARNIVKAQLEDQTSVGTVSKENVPTSTILEKNVQVQRRVVYKPSTQKVTTINIDLPKLIAFIVATVSICTNKDQAGNPLEKIIGLSERLLDITLTREELETAF